MREAVKILIDRMVSHPEEFKKGGKLGWTTTASAVSSDWGLTSEEANALREAYQQCKYQLFHNTVMRCLLDDTTTPTTDYLMVQGSSLRPTKTEHEVLA